MASSKRLSRREESQSDRYWEQNMLVSEEFTDSTEEGGTAYAKALACDTLCHFTLSTYFERMIEHRGYYRPPDGEPLYCASTSQQLQWMAENVDPENYPQQDRVSDGLLLYIDVEKIAPVLDSSQGSDIPFKLLQAIPREAIRETRKIPRKATNFSFPPALDLPPQRPRNRIRRITSAIQGCGYVYLAAVLIGLFFAVFPSRFPGEGATRWITYFLNDGGTLSVACIAALFSAGAILLVLPLARLKIGIEKEGAQVVPILNVFRIIQPLDPGSQSVGSRMLVGLGLASLALSVAGLWLWYSLAEVDAVEFQVRQLGMDTRHVASGQIVTVPERAVLEIQALLPPHLARYPCTWNASSTTAIIRQGLGGCQAVYDARSTTGDDLLEVNVQRQGGSPARGSFTVRVETDGS
jgi:hypothetical protein